MADPIGTTPDLERLYAANAAAAAFYQQRLAASPTAAAYLREHGITAAAGPDTPWTLGYAPASWTDLTNHLRHQGFTDTEIHHAGLAFIRRANGHLLDRFRDRLMFPITDEHHRIVGFTARDLSTRNPHPLGQRRNQKPNRDRDRDRRERATSGGNSGSGASGQPGKGGRDHAARLPAKWINTPETPIYRKSRLLYGLGPQLARAHPAPGAQTSTGARSPTGAGAGAGRPSVLVVEGAADVLAVHQMAAHRTGPDQAPVYAVAPCGTTLTHSQLDLLHRTMPDARLILAFDGDTAGQHALNRAYPTATQWPGETRAIPLPAGTDPASLLANLGPQPALARLLDHTQPLAQVAMTHTLRQLLATGHITNPREFAEDRLLAYRAIADYFVDAPPHHQHLAETAAELLGLNPTDITRGVLETITAGYETTTGTDPPTSSRPTSGSQTGPRAEPATGPGETAETTPATPPTRPDTTPPRIKPPTGAPISVSAHATSPGRRRNTTASATRHDHTTGITVWALAHGLGNQPEATTTATMACDIATTVTAHGGPAAALHTVRAAINAYYDGHHPSQAGDAAILIVAAHPDPTTRHGIRYHLAWAGDCRAYTLHHGKLTQVTADHTIARQRHDTGQPVPEGSLTERLLTSSVRAGPISLCQLPDGPLLLSTASLHRQLPHHLLAAELAGTTNAQTTADRLITTAAHHSTDSLRTILIHPATAVPALVTTTGPGPAAQPVTATGTPAALARTSYPTLGHSPATQPASSDSPTATEPEQPRPRRAP